ncbi:MAG: hypothetical protein COA73_17830 [Candidatus Hydrogenedentota bacterium]|nr:MAG: hypothetical protein COA73_17830 [Candidatus Hydrogenedentota bacterium]
MDIKIGKSARQCTACENDFVHEHVIYTLLNTNEEELTREDYCDPCWNDEKAKTAYSSWTSQFYDPQVAEQQPEETFSPLRQIFYDVVENKERQSQSIAYLAAQLLRRQKVFRLIKETEDLETEENLILFNDRIGNRLIEVHDAKLTHAEMDAGRIELISRLALLENPETTENEDTETMTEEPLAVVAESTETP